MGLEGQQEDDVGVVRGKDFIATFKLTNFPK